jgi:hypothetical protein
MRRLPNYEEDLDFSSASSDAKLFFKPSRKLTKSERRKLKKDRKKAKRLGSMSSDVDPYTGQLTGSPISDEYHFAGRYIEHIDFKKMHRITSYLASGAIGCDVDDGWIVLPVYDLDDNDINVDKVKAKVKLAVRLLNEGHKVCVCCAAGINRSNTIAIGTLMMIDKINLDWHSWQLFDVWNEFVRNKVEQAAISPVIRNTLLEAVEEMKFPKEVIAL